MDCPLCAEAATQPFQHVAGRDYHRCPSCQATFLDPAQRPERQREHDHYRGHHNCPDDPTYRAFLRRLAEPLLARLAAASSGLDYGCGPGPALARMLEEAGHSVALYDPLFAADTAALQRQYDFVACSEVVEHFHQPATEFARLDGLLRPGGLLAVMTSFQSDDAHFAGWHYRRDPTHVIFYREATFHHLAARFGWRCEIPARNVALLYKPELLAADLSQ